MFHKNCICEQRLGTFILSNSFFSRGPGVGRVGQNHLRLALHAAMLSAGSEFKDHLGYLGSNLGSAKKALYLRHIFLISHISKRHFVVGIY